ncbi:MAG: hypothetical protein ACPF8V_02490, partial [Luteibaculum sp.]
MKSLNSFLFLSLLSLNFIVQGQNYLNEQKVVANDRERFSGGLGSDVAINFNQILAGAYWEDKDSVGVDSVKRAGAIYIYELQNTGKWSQVQKLVHSDRNSDDELGESLASHGKYMVAGMEGYGSDGGAFLFKRGGDRKWTEVDSYEPADGFTLGTDVSIFDDFVLVSDELNQKDENDQNYMAAAGAVYIL